MDITTSTTSTTTSVGYSGEGGNVKTTAKKSALQKKAEQLQSINFNSNTSELAKLKKDQLLQLCYDNKMNVIKSGKKQYYIDEIVKLRDEQSRLRRILVDENTLNQFHRGYVEYKLPVLLIVRIFRQCWRLATSRSNLGYKEALALTLVSKQFNGFVTPWFTNVVLLRVWDNFNERFTRPWCPIKHIVKLKVNQPTFTMLMNKKKVSIYLAQMLTSVEKLHIVWDEYSNAAISSASIKRLPLLMPNLRYLVCVSIKLDIDHIDAIMDIKTLTKIDLSRPYKGLGDYDLFDVKHPLEKIFLREICLNTMPRDESYRMTIKEIGYVSLNSDSKPKPLDLPNLQKISFAMYAYPPNTFSYFKQETFNITYLAAFISKKKRVACEWVKVIEQLKCIVTVEDLNPHSKSSGYNNRGRLCIGLKDCLSPTLSRIIVYSNYIDGAEQYLSSIGYKYSFHTFSGHESTRESHKAIYYDYKIQSTMKKYFFDKEVRPPAHGKANK